MKKGVDRADIADIMRLKTRNPEESSYCLSLNTEKANGIVLSTDIWPDGIIVRRYHTVRRNTGQRNHHEKAPRFRNGREK